MRKQELHYKQVKDRALPDAQVAVYKALYSVQAAVIIQESGEDVTIHLGYNDITFPGGRIVISKS